MILDEILAHKRREVAAEVARMPLAHLERAAAAAPAARAFAAALRAPGVSVIAEFKRRSPSGGALRPGASAGDVAEVAASYAANGAAALSVLVDQAYFGGSFADLTAARQASGLPTLCKEFILDRRQVLQARAAGADAVLLIVRALDQAALEALLEEAHGLGMDALVEAHAADEVRRALAAGARIVGVNNRDLDTLATDPTLAPRLRPLVPPEVVVVAESGISTPEQMARLRTAGIHAALVGEALLRAPDPGARLADLARAGAGTIEVPA